MKLTRIQLWTLNSTLCALAAFTLLSQDNRNYYVMYLRPVFLSS